MPDDKTPDDLDLPLPPPENAPEVKVEKTIKTPQDAIAALLSRLGVKMDADAMNSPEGLFAAILPVFDTLLLEQAAKAQADIAWKSNMGDQVQSLKTLLIAPDGRNRLDVINANLHVLYEVLTNPKYQTIRKVGP